VSVAYTPRQGQYLAFIHAYTRRFGIAPSEAEIASHFMVSPPSAHQMVVALEQRGLVRRTSGQARSLRVILPASDIPDLDGRTTPRPEKQPTAENYPHVARWIQDDGWVELGRDGHSRSLARALDEGGIVWEGKDSYPDLDELLRDLEAGIAAWTAKLG